MDKRDFAIRAANPGDAEELAELMRGLHAHLKEPVEHISAAALRRDVLHEGSVHSILVAEREGKLIGYALFHETYESIYAQRGVYIADLFVVKDARGAGIGRALVAAVACTARTRGLKFVWWVSDTWNEDAQGFYATLGATHEPSVAHGLTFDDFTALADEGEKNNR